MSEVERLRQVVTAYRAAVGWIAADSWDGCRDCMDMLKAASAYDGLRDPMTSDELAAALTVLRPFKPPPMLHDHEPETPISSCCQEDGWACGPFSDQESEIARLHALLARCRTVLGNMARENEGAIFNRWPIDHEPLRNDARNLLPLIDEAIPSEEHHEHR